MWDYNYIRTCKYPLCLHYTWHIRQFLHTSSLEAILLVLLQAYCNYKACIPRPQLQACYGCSYGCICRRTTINIFSMCTFIQNEYLYSNNPCCWPIIERLSGYVWMCCRWFKSGILKEGQQSSPVPAFCQTSSSISNTDLYFNDGIQCYCFLLRPHRTRCCSQIVLVDNVLCFYIIAAIRNGIDSLGSIFQLAHKHMLQIE